MIKPLFGLLGGSPAPSSARRSLPWPAHRPFTIFTALRRFRRDLGGATIGAVTGLVLGIGVSLWLILRQEGKWAGTAVAWLWVGALFMIGCLGFVAFS